MFCSKVYPLLEKKQLSCVHPSKCSPLLLVSCTNQGTVELIALENRFVNFLCHSCFLAKSVAAIFHISSFCYMLVYIVLAFFLILFRSLSLSIKTVFIMIVFFHLRMCLCVHYDPLLSFKTVFMCSLWSLFSFKTVFMIILFFPLRQFWFWLFFSSFRRIQEILPGRVKEWRETPCIANEKAQTKLKELKKIQEVLYEHFCYIFSS